MATNYSRNDKLKGNELWKVGVSLAIAMGLLFGGVKYMNKINRDDYNSRKEIRNVQSSDLELLSECEGGMK